MASSSATNAREQCDSNSVDQDALSRVRHLDVMKDITYKCQSVAAYGGYSEVFRGRLRKGVNVHVDIAVKRLRFHVDEAKVKRVRPFFASLQGICWLTRLVQQFAQEVYVWSKLSHPNVLPLLGFAICEETRFPLLVSEWMHLGTAWTYVQSNQELRLLYVAVLVCSVYHVVEVLSG